MARLSVLCPAISLIFIVLGASAARPACAAAPDAARECVQCHGETGVSQDKNIPSIAGMSAFYLDGQIQAYQKSQRPCPKTKFPKDPAKPATDMCEIAKKLSSADSSAIDKYFSSQAFVAANQAFDSKVAAAGKQIHTADCEICHTQGGSVADDDAGILAGQWMPYLQDTFKEYQSGKRLMPEKMKPKLSKLTAEQIDELVQYYVSEKK